MSKIVYQFDEKGFYLYPTEADESPLEPGVYLFPRNTTEIKPPTVTGNQKAKWNGKTWIIETFDSFDPANKIIDFFLKNPDVWAYVCQGVQTKTLPYK